VMEGLGIGLALSIQVPIKWSAGKPLIHNNYLWKPTRTVYRLRK